MPPWTLLERELRALAEYDGSNPTREPKVSKLRSNRNANDVIIAFNTVLPIILEDDSTLQKFRTLIYRRLENTIKNRDDLQNSGKQHLKTNVRRICREISTNSNLSKN